MEIRKQIISDVAEEITSNKKNTSRNSLYSTTEVMKKWETRFAEINTRVTHVEAVKVDKHDVSFAIKANPLLEKKAAQMQEIESNEKLLAYYRAFVSTFSSTYTSTQVIVEGKVSLNTDSLAVTLAAHAISLMPFGGQICSSGIKAFGKFLKSVEFLRMANKFIQIASNHTSLDDFVETIARDITLHSLKRQQLMDYDIEPMTSSWIGGMVAEFKKAGVKIKEEFYHKRYSTPEAQLGHKDAVMAINMYVSGKLEEHLSISEGIINVVIEKTHTEVELHSPLPSKDDKCIVMNLTDVIYGNPMLNNPDPQFLQKMYENCGAELTNWIMDLCGKESIVASVLD